MTKWILMGAVVAVGSMFVSGAEAQEQIRPAGTIITSGQPTTQPQRTGILGRLRGNRRPMTSTAEPMLAQPATTTQTPPVTVQPSTTTTVVPQQMQVVETRRGLFGRSRPTYQMVPVTQPMPATTTPSKTTSTSGIIQAQGSTTAPGGVVQAQGTTVTPGVAQTTTVPMTTANMMPMNEGRQGLLGRLRSRLGR
jgi:hypothetical protein